MSEHDEYKKAYSDDGFWEKCSKYAKVAGKSVMKPALTLYFAFPKAPLWAQGTIIGALGYFISPIDAIPDFTPFLGYADDLGVLTAAAAAVGVAVDGEVKQKADEKLADWGLADD
jgi:uncharacterized membrane protein YkvA (DUF1232 family)